MNIIKDDPPDNIIISTALSADAPYIISGDRRLQFLKKFQKIKII